MSTPVFLDPREAVTNFSTLASPTLYPGTTVRAKVSSLDGASVRMYAIYDGASTSAGPWTPVGVGRDDQLEWTVPNDGIPFRLGLSLTGATRVHLHTARLGRCAFGVLAVRDPALVDLGHPTARAGALGEFGQELRGGLRDHLLRLAPGPARCRHDRDPRLGRLRSLLPADVLTEPRRRPRRPGTRATGTSPRPCSTGRASRSSSSTTPSGPCSRRRRSHSGVTRRTTSPSSAPDPSSGCTSTASRSLRRPRGVSPAAGPASSSTPEP